MTLHQLITVHSLVHDAAGKFGAATAVSDEATSLSFAELRETALNTAAALRANGVARGDRVGICMAKSAEQAIAILGVLLADAVIVPILPGLKRDNIEHIVTDAGMRVAITDGVRAGDLQDAAPGLPLLFGVEPAAVSAASVDPGAVLPRTCAAMSGGSVPQQAIGDDLAAIIYSSGSTGRPKGIMVTHRNLWQGAHITARYLWAPGQTIASALYCP